MKRDLKLLRWLCVLVALPIALAIFGNERFRYPCQNPINWNKDICKMPLCDVTRTCPDHIFKGQRDPNTGPLKPGQQSIVPPTNGAECGK